MYIFYKIANNNNILKENKIAKWKVWGKWQGH